MSDFCHNCGKFREAESGLYVTIGISAIELDQPANVIKQIIDLKLEQVKRQFAHKLGLEDGTHDLSRGIK